MATQRKGTQRRYACGVCGHKAVAENMIYSHHTGSRYCADYMACVRRRKRQPKRVGA